MTTKIETTTCEGEDGKRCDAEWFVRNPAAGVVAYFKPGNGGRGSKRVESQQAEVGAYTSDEILWEWECPFCGHAESDYIHEEDRA